MLLVKSRESKNLNKPCSPNIVLASVSSLLLVTLSMPVQANANTASLTSAGSILTVFLSLMVVIAIIFAFAYVMRRFNVASMGNGQMRVVASMMAGTKEKVMVMFPVTLNPNGINPARFKNQIKKNTVNKKPMNFL